MSEVKQKAKGTPKTEAIIGAASNKIVTATKSLNDAVAAALKLTQTLDENALKIADQEEKLQNLQTEYANKRTQQHIDLDLAYKADQKQFAEQYLAANTLVAVEKDEYVSLQQELEELKQNFNDKVRTEVGKAEGIANSRAKAAEELAQARYEAKEAGNLAEIKNLQAQLNFANQQISVWKTQLDEERKAGVERAKASAIGTVSVTGAGK